MTKNPFFNAVCASAYIVLIVSIMEYVMRTIPHPKTIMVPITVLSLFTLSAAMMGYFFLYQPGQLYLEGKKKEAVKLFLQTVGTFAVITASILILLFSGILH